MSFDYSQELVNDYERLLEVGENYDVIIYAGKGENMEKIHAHSLILCARSQYFHTALINQWASKEDGKFILKNSNISPRILKTILRFIYCGRVDLMNLQGLELLEFLIVANEFSIQVLVSCIQEYLIDHQHELLQQNPIEILEIVYQLIHHDTFKSLCEFFLETFCENPKMLFKFDNLIRLRAPLLELLLKRDDLLLDEIEIWDNLIKWSFAQHPSIQQDVKKLNKEEIAIMKSTLQNFIPLIRFNNISSKDFYFKLYPFKVILTDDLAENILEFHMVPNKKLNNVIQPPRRSKYDTHIVKSEHFSIFSSWIDKKNDFYYKYYNQKDLPYHFNLIYRASRDGNKTKVFHKKCDNKGATIVIVKVKGSEQIFGGYNPIDWESNGSSTMVKDSFLFSFADRNKVKTAKIGYESSMSFYPGYGPMFGYHLYYQNYHNTWVVNNNFLGNYLNIKVPLAGYVYSEDFEVFQVVKKQ
ncbi:hypothetical protein RclHR1_02140024 [Rhizophagus clarus]|uniref:BTB/POZ domain-containing protein n=1 Tax=Rhizophagus clarus TaxID=94130 RepID=A0A2Z6R8H3_9GLOM|nr:hypothetical protein RclHR1_02140024 [Rhizophagus clarus]GES84963.1 BTB/POZ domain-containing protein [Rhizophagus clarus]